MKNKMVYMITGIIPYTNGARTTIAVYLDKVWDEYCEKQRKKKRNINLLRKIAEYILD